MLKEGYILLANDVAVKRYNIREDEIHFVYFMKPNHKTELQILKTKAKLVSKHLEPIMRLLYD